MVRNELPPEPLAASWPAVEEQEVNFFEWPGTYEVPRLGDFSCGTSIRGSQPDRGIASCILVGPDV